LHFSIEPPVLNLYVKYDANHFIQWSIYGYFTTLPIWLRNAYFRPFWAVFWGIWSLKSSRILSRPPRGTPLAVNMRFLQIVPIAQEMRPDLGALKKTKRRKTEKEVRNVTSHIFPRPPTLRYRHQSCHVGWGPRRSQPCQVSSKSVHGFWLPDGPKSAIFLCLALWLI